MATTTDATTTDATTDEGWYAEIEWRRHLRNKYPDDANHTLPTKPNLARAEHYDPPPSTQSFCEFYSDKILFPLETARKLSPDELEQKSNWLTRKLHIYETEHPVSGKRVFTPKDGFNLSHDEITLLKENAPAKQFREASERGYDVGEKEIVKGTLENDHSLDPDPRPIYVRVPPDHPLCTLQNIIDQRRKENRDAKVLVTARDGETGTGKTTLAVQLAKSWDTNGWDASKATLEGDKYIDAYTELEPGSVLIGDELEGMADPRRSMSAQNVTLTQFWATMRQWEVSTICTFPSMRMVDVRLLELADIRINVLQRGVAVANRVKIGDYDGEVSEVPLHRIRWEPLDHDPDYQTLTDKKTERMENAAERLYYLQSDEDQEDTPDPDEVRRETRNEIIRNIYEENGLTQKEIADAVDLDRSTVSKIVNS